MSGLAKYLISVGKICDGYDRKPNSNCEELINLGARVSDSIDTDISEYDIIVKTDAIDDDNPLLCRARSANQTIISRGQLLYEISKCFETVIGISGCHGKTSCTAMLAHILKSANYQFAAHIGGNDLEFGNFYMCGDKYFISEACEYKKNFLLLKPDIAICLNSAADHLECYQDAKKLKESYQTFISNAEVGICLYGDIKTAGLTFGFDKRADFYAKNISRQGEQYSFTVTQGQSELGEIDMSICGKHNVLNALAAIAAARVIGVDYISIYKGIASFQGVERRFENIGYFGGVLCIADYAHHPDEIKAVYRTAKRMTKKEVFVVFQPHTYSRTKNLFSEFVQVLGRINKLLIYKTFAAREYYDDSGSALTLSSKIKKSRYAESEQEIEKFLSNAKRGDLILFLGAGDIYEIAKQIIKNQR